MIPRPVRVPEVRDASKAFRSKLAALGRGTQDSPDSSSSTSPHRLGGFENRADDPVMGPAAAEIADKSEPDVGLARVRVAVENRFGHHDDAGDAVAALRRLFRHESRLQRVGPLKRPETFERGDLGLRKRTDRRDARA